MVSLGRKNRKLAKSDYPGGTYIAETSPGPGPSDDQTAEPTMTPQALFLDEPAVEPRKTRTKPQKSFILTGRSALILGGLGLVIATWAFFVGLLFGLGFLFEDKAFDRMKALLSDKRATGEREVGTIPKVEKEVMALLNVQSEPAPPKPEPASPPPDPKPAPPAKAASTGTDGKFAVQVAATHTEPDAQKLVDDLDKKGFKAYFFKATVDGRSYYRVRVGHFETMAEAREAMKKLDGHGFEGMFIWRLKDES